MPPRLSDLTYKPPLEPYVSIVYRDDDILVLDKPSGLLSVPGRDPALFDSLIMRVREQFPQAHLINRLDKDTSGIVLMGLNKKAHSVIGTQFEKRTTKKLYTAIVWGHLQEDAGFVDLPLAGDPDNKPCHRVDHENGKPSQTEWQVLDRLPTGATRVSLVPLTGRTHQLRVHMQSIGHPILGDRFYAEGAALAASARLMLHAEKLGFLHPNGQDMTFTVPCPF
jgi:tRNA pseudouridine32 synthase/23S rRNA pseudouridine746 synthase